MLNVITPYYNESQRLQPMLADMAAALRECKLFNSPVKIRFCWANDGSTDDSRVVLLKNTSELLPQSLGAFQIEHKFVDLAKNSGKASAMRAGITAILSQNEINSVVSFWDADGELDPHGLLAMLHEIASGKADVVFGSRFNKRNPQVLNFRHYLGNKSLTVLSNWFSDLNLSDVHCCARAMKGILLQRLPMKSTGFDFEAEFVGLVGVLNRNSSPAPRLIEIPVGYRPRTRAQGKKISFRHVLPQIWQALRCRYSVKLH